MQALNNKKKLYELLAQGATVVTPTKRLSTVLLQNFFLTCTDKTVTKPLCVPYTTLLNQIYQSMVYETQSKLHPVLLSDFQATYLWRKIIKAESEVNYSEGLLNAIVQAWEYCQLWEVDPYHSAFAHTPQTLQFQRWWHKFTKQLEKAKVVCLVQVVPYLLAEQYRFGTSSVVWACFDNFHPQQLSLQNYLNQAGIQQFCYEIAASKTMPKLVEAADSKDEINQLMAWLQIQLNKGHKNIGVVVPDLAYNARVLQRAMEHYFNKNLFNIFLAQSLIDFSLVSHALVWLNLNHNMLTAHQAALLLQSPYIGNAKEEFLARAQYLQDSVLLQEHFFSLSAFKKDIQILVPKLAKLLNKLKPYPERASVGEWIQLFQERLNSLGFPGDYGLNSNSYQCFNRFTELFDEFRQLNLLSTSLKTKEALDIFTHLTKYTLFQAQKSNTSIQIISLLEASGCEFDSLWVMNLTDEKLPQKIHLSAFIPPQLQRELSMPYSDWAQELQLAQHTLQRLKNSSKSIVFSYAKLQADKPNLPCSLITQFPLYRPIASQENIRQKSHLITMEEMYLVPLSKEESLSGGTALVSNQAKCPFRAFAEHRLKAKPCLYAKEGWDSREKGKIIHKVMELLWGKLESQKKLLDLTYHKVNELVDEVIIQALKLTQYEDTPFYLLMQELEPIRLKRVVLASLEWEKKRPGFSIAALEQSYTLTIAGLDFKLRIDRIDKVEEKKWVIDYKSSLSLQKPWHEDRPQEPQLLLYALLDEQINALVLLQLKTGKNKCQGLSEQHYNLEGLYPLKKTETWAECKDKWIKQLTLLVQELQQGHCPPQPVQASLCMQCDFQNLCRYY